MIEVINTDDIKRKLGVNRKLNEALFIWEFLWFRLAMQQWQVFWMSNHTCSKTRDNKHGECHWKILTTTSSNLTTVRKNMVLLYSSDPFKCISLLPWLVNEYAAYDCLADLGMIWVISSTSRWLVNKDAANGSCLANPGMIWVISIGYYTILIIPACFDPWFTIVTPPRKD